MRIRVLHTLDDLEDDMRGIVRRARPDMREVVRDGIRAGNTDAAARARVSAGAHGKHYHRAFSAEMHTGLGLFGNVISGEWGPDINKPQGGMSFEDGSRNQRPHRDLAKSGDLIEPIFGREVAQLPARWFW